MKIDFLKPIGVFFLTILSVLLILPSLSGEYKDVISDKKLKLGLDLQGGSHLLLEVDFNSYIHDQLMLMSDSIKRELREVRLGYKNFIISQNDIAFEIRNANELEQVVKAIRKIDTDINITPSNTSIHLSFSEPKLQLMATNLVDRSIEVIRKRVDEHGTLEPIIQRQGAHYIVLQIPGETNPDNLRKLIGKTAKLGFYLVDSEASISFVSGTKKSFANRNIVSGDNGALVLHKSPVVTGEMLSDAQVALDENRHATVNFSLNDTGTRLFSRFTKENVGNRLAIVLDNNIISAPTINNHIPTGSTRITGNFTIESANELALLLRTGSLPAPLNIIEERSIGPNLGADSIEAGKLAGVVGLLSVMLFMFLSYGMFGLFANIALVLTLLYIMSMLTLFEATLTLPGIAGIILTIGMAVDANVLIYERIREEANLGHSNSYAIYQGFKAAFGTIADSNITTVLAALLLYVFGVGAIKGFAVTLTIGIIASMFSAIVITKMLIDAWIKWYKPKSLGI